MIDQGLMRRCRTGDQHAQSEVYALTSSRIYRLLLRMTGNRDDASDLAQETYVRAFSRIDQFDEHASFETWLFRIAINEALQLKRRAKSSATHLKQMPPRAFAESERDHQDRKLDVRDAIAALEAKHQAVLLLRYQEGLNYREIAKIMGCAEGTVASKLNRARDQIRNLLQENYGSAEESGAPLHPKGGERRTEGADAPR